MGIGIRDGPRHASLSRVILPDARATARSVRRITESRAAGRGLRVAIVMPLLLAFFEWIKLPQGAFLASFATLSMLVIGDFSGPRRERFTSIVVTGAAGAGTLALGAALAAYPYVLIPAALVLGTFVALLGVLRGFMARATIPILLPFFLAATTAKPMAALVQMEIGWCVGTLVSAVAAITMWPYFPRARLTEAMCDAMQVAAAALRSYFATPAADDRAERLVAVSTSMQRVRDLFAGQLKRPGNSYRRERFLVALVEELRRLRIGLLTQLPRVPADPPARDRDLGQETADALDQAAQHLRDGRDDLGAFGMLNEARVVHRARVVDATAQHLAEAQGAAAGGVVIDSFPVRSLSMLSLVPVRDASVAHGDEAVPHITFRGRRMPTTLAPRGPWHRVRGELSWSAPWFRNSFRLGLALALALTVVELTSVQRGYWVVLGTLSVMRLDLLSTGRTAWQVVQGQLLGFCLGVLIIPLTTDAHWLAWALLPPLAFAQGYVANNKGIIVQQMMFTALLVDLVMVTSPRRDIALLRLTDVLIGLAVAIVVSVLVFPRGLVPRVQSSVSAAVVAAGDLLVAQTRLLSTRVLSHQDAATSSSESAMADAEDLKVRAAIEQAAETIRGWGFAFDPAARLVVGARLLSGGAVLARAALWPERYPVEALERIRAVNPRAFEALYQGNPTPREGALFLVSRLGYASPAEVPPMVRLVRRWDMASTKGGDYTVGVLMGTDENGRFWVLDVVRAQFEPDARNRLILETAWRDGQGVSIVGPEDPGAAGKDAALAFARNLSGFSVRSVRETGSKELRADPYAAQVNASNVTLVRGAWNSAYVEELRQFPAGAHDDQVDASSGAFSELSSRQILEWQVF